MLKENTLNQCISNIFAENVDKMGVVRSSHYLTIRIIMDDVESKNGEVFISSTNNMLIFNRECSSEKIKMLLDALDKVSVGAKLFHY